MIPFRCSGGVARGLSVSLEADVVTHSVVACVGCA